MDRASLIAVAEDLEYLGAWSPDISPAEVRRGTAVLRRLLVEDAYGTAWRALGQAKQPTLIAVDLDAASAHIPNGPHFAIAGGAHFRGMKIAALVMHGGAPMKEAREPPMVRADGFPFEREFSLSEFLSSKSGYSDRRAFTRRDVIKYLANVKGGVHLSAQQRKTEEKLIARMTKVEQHVRVLNADALIVEAVALAQAVGASKDARTLCGMVRQVHGY